MNATSKTVGRNRHPPLRPHRPNGRCGRIHVSGENRTLYQPEHIPFHRRMTMARLERLCRRIAKALDTELYGTVNIDFVSLSDGPTFDLLLVERGERRVIHA